tara:strand:+ start:875 stop:1078 length:204 start_codon:yes stop_codon:yes gene_type:complete
MNTAIKYKNILIILLIICIGIMGYKIHELRNDSISRFINCFEPELYLTDKPFCKKNLEKLGVTFGDE